MIMIYLKLGVIWQKNARRIKLQIVKNILWLKVNKLALNIGKTHFMVFTNNKKRLDELNILIDGTKIGEVEKE